MLSITGHVALVTGAATGIGRAISLALAHEGATVVLVGRRQAPLEEVRGEIESAGGHAMVVALDVTDAAAVQATFAQVTAEVGAVDILVNNAGSSTPTRNPQWMSVDEWRQVVEVNLTAVFSCTQAVLDGMLQRGRGTIVTVSSIAALTPNLLGGAAYGAAKAGARNFMSFLHGTFRDQGIRAITVIPGETDTPILDDRVRPPATNERAHMVQPDDVARAVLLAVTIPARTVMQELTVLPTRQRDLSVDLEVSRWAGAPPRRENSKPIPTATATKEL